MFRLLVLADVHYTSDEADAASAPAGRHCLLGLELTRRAIEDARLRARAATGAAAHGKPFDAIALMGDLVNDGTRLLAEADLAALRREIASAAPETPLLVVPGNHDNVEDKVLRAFGCRPGVAELGGYRFVVFADPYEDFRYCTRRPEDLALVHDLARRPGGPIVALQHNPMNPIIDDPYPFMLTNRLKVMQGYSRAGVLLSISGHFHAGQEPNTAGGVTYFTAPGLCESPLPYAMVTLDGRSISAEVRRLVLPLPVVDVHAHTEFAYCGSGITAEGAIRRARLLGLGGLWLTEHAPQLYCQADDFWHARHVHQPNCWRAGGHTRMPRFRDAMHRLKQREGGFVRIALEVELDADGHLTVRDEDRPWVDRLIGAIHWLPVDTAALSDAGLARHFMRANEAILKAGVHVLAHPWRVFRRLGRAVSEPKSLYSELADMLAEHGVAAELNFHTNDPEPAFFAECIRRGVKIALGSDAHEPWEVGLLGPHLDFVRAVAGADEISGLLLDLPPTGGGAR